MIRRSIKLNARIDITDKIGIAVTVFSVYKELPEEVMESFKKAIESVVVEHQKILLEGP